MLEHLSLWVSAATATWPPGIPRTGRYLRWVLTGDARLPVGHVAVTPGRWWPWPAGRRARAYESPDNSLLFTAGQSGWLRWRVIVADADANPVAHVRGSYVIGRDNRFVGYRRPAVDGPGGLFIGPHGVEVARWGPDGVGT